MCGFLNGHFQEIFIVDNISHVQEVCQSIHFKLSDDDHSILTTPYTRSEIYEALKFIHPSKALGLDGLNAAFFQTYWHIVGDEVTSIV